MDLEPRIRKAAKKIVAEAAKKLLSSLKPPFPEPDIEERAAERVDEAVFEYDGSSAGAIRLEVRETFYGYDLRTAEGKQKFERLKEASRSGPRVYLASSMGIDEEANIGWKYTFLPPPKPQPSNQSQIFL